MIEKSRGPFNLQNQNVLPFYRDLGSFSAFRKIASLPAWEEAWYAAPPSRPASRSRDRDNRCVGQPIGRTLAKHDAGLRADLDLHQPLDCEADIWRRKLASGAFSSSARRLIISSVIGGIRAPTLTGESPVALQVAR